MPDDRKKIDSIFLEAVEIESETGRARFLDRACAGDADLRARVEKLLEADGKAGSFFQDTGDTSAFPPPVSEGPGERVGPYKLLQVIGEGGMGTVYLAEQTDGIDRRVALKIIKAGLDDREFIARFEAERQALALMDHPGIAKVFDTGSTESGRPYFVMELVQGIPITQYADQRKLGTRRRLELFVGVCHAVQHAHQKGIIHRDLKPANILVAEYDGAPVPKVIDFGVAKAMTQKLTEKTMFTQYGQLVGTLEYMSPEQARLTPLDIDTRSDIYALGVLLYELLTGATPFDRQRLQAEGLDEILRIIREVEPPKPSTRISTLGAATGDVCAVRGTGPNRLRRALRGELDWIVMRALEKDRNRRYESASAFAADVERFLNDEAVHACPPSAAYRARKFVRRNRGAVLAGGLLVLALLLGLAGTGFGLLEARDQGRDALRARDAERAVNFRLALDKGLTLCDEGHVAPGMLWLAEALARCPEDRPAMARVVRANLNAWRRELNELQGMFPHDRAVVVVAVSPDGLRLVTGSTDHTAQLWNLRTGRPIGPPMEHKGDVHEAKFNADGTRLLTSDYATHAFLWDGLDGTLIHEFAHDELPDPEPEPQPQGETSPLVETGMRCAGVVGATFRPPHEKEIVTSCGNGVITVWDAETGAPLGHFKKQPHMVHDIAVSADGTRLLTSCHDKNAKVWDYETREVIATFRHGTRVTASVFRGESRDEIVTGDGDGNVFIWSVERACNAAEATLTTSDRAYEAGPWRQNGVVHRLRVTPDGSRILAASFDNTAREWRPGARVVGRVPFEHEAAVQFASFVPGERVATACDDKAARLWRPAPGQAVRFRRIETGPKLEGIYSKDGRYLLVKPDTEVDRAALHDTGTGQLLREFDQPGGVRAIAVSPDRSKLLTGGKAECWLWDIETGERITNHGLASPTMSVDFSADGTSLLAAGFGQDCIVHAVGDGAARRPPLKLRTRIWGAAFSTVGSTFAIACEDHVARVYAPVDAGEPMLIRGHRSSVAAVSFSPDGRFLVTGSHDNTMRVWEVRTGDPVSPFMPHRGPIWYSICVAFSPDGKTVVSGCDDRTARVWDVATAKPIGPRLVHENGIRMVAFLDDRQVVTGTAAGEVRVWNAERWPLRGDIGWIRTWVEARTGMRLDDKNVVQALDAGAWRARMERLAELGGEPDAG